MYLVAGRGGRRLSAADASVWYQTGCGNSVRFPITPAAGLTRAGCRRSWQSAQVLARSALPVLSKSAVLLSGICPANARPHFVLARFATIVKAGNLAAGPRQGPAAGWLERGYGGPSARGGATSSAPGPTERTHAARSSSPAATPSSDSCRRSASSVAVSGHSRKACGCRCWARPAARRR